MFLEKHWSKRIKESKGNEVSCIASFEATTFESNEGGIEGEVCRYFPRWEPCASTVELGMFRLIY